MATESKFKEATVKAYIPTMFGSQILTTKDEMLYLPERVKAKAGVKFMYKEHKAGETHKVLNGKEVTFKNDGIHDYLIVRDAEEAQQINVRREFVALMEE